MVDVILTLFLFAGGPAHEVRVIPATLDQCRIEAERFGRVGYFGQQVQSFTCTEETIQN